MKPNLSEAERLKEDARLVAESGFFDEAAYRRDHPELADGNREPVEHYLVEGWLNGADPSARFSTKYYLRVNSDVRSTGMHPLVHFLRYGRAEGRAPLPDDSPRAGEAFLRSPLAPSDEDWRLLAERRRPRSGQALVDVIVPVYRGFHETLRCLYSVLESSQETPYDLVVVDDHGPEPELREALNTLARDGWISLHATPGNQGFVGASNFGMKLHVGRDVVLLNSDTQVYGNWLDRLRAAALSVPQVATVTPFSNNAEIASYPRFLRDNMRGLELSDVELDRLAAKVNAGEVEDIPTGVGFCMYIRRDCLNEIGLFDQGSFGRGYGEENDLCRRAAAAGWRNLLAADVFVRHYGATSFGSDKTERVQQALQTMERLHPGYLGCVGEFIRADPIRGRRSRLDLGRMARRASRSGGMLVVTHNMKGGTERHVQDLAASLEGEGVAVSFCRPDQDDPNRVRLNDPVIWETPNLQSFDTRRDLIRFADTLVRGGIGHVHIHHLAGFPEDAPDFMRVACGMAGIAYDVTVHDYLFVCPRFHFVDRSGVYCGEPELAACEACMASDESRSGHASVWRWRDRYGRLLREARRVYVPDIDVARRIRSYFPDLGLHVRPHPEPRFTAAPSIGKHDRLISEKGTRRIAVIGAIGPAKGSRLFLDCARQALQRGLPLRFVLIGYTDRDEEFAELENVTLTGAYAEDELPGRLSEAGAAAAWFPSVCPETYSYTLSAALAHPLFPVAFDLGAIASRIRSCGWGSLMPFEWMLQPETVAGHLAAMSISAPPETRLFQPATYPNVVSSYYGLPLPLRRQIPRECHGQHVRKYQETWHRDADQAGAQSPSFAHTGT